MSWSDHKEWRYVLSWSDLSGLNALPTGLDRLGFEWVASWNNQLGFSDAKSRCNFELSPMYHGIWSNSITGFDAHAGKAPASNTCVVPCLRCSMKTSIKSRVPLDPFSTLDTLGRWEHGFRSHIAATTRAPQCSSNVHEPWIVARFQHCLSNSTTGKSNQWAEEFGCNIWHDKYKSARKKKELHWLNH